LADPTIGAYQELVFLLVVIEEFIPSFQKIIYVIHTLDGLDSGIFVCNINTYFFTCHTKNQTRVFGIGWICYSCKDYCYFGMRL
jgi:hypothetical protein